MSLAEIKNAVEALAPPELEELIAFIREHDSAAWDCQIERDSASGKLDFLFDEAEQARAANPRELGELAAKLADETDPAKAQLLKEELTTGFYGGKPVR